MVFSATKPTEEPKKTDDKKDPTSTTTTTDDSHKDVEEVKKATHADPIVISDDDNDASPPSDLTATQKHATATATATAVPIPSMKLETINHVQNVAKSSGAQEVHTMARLTAPKLPAEQLAAAREKKPLHITAVMDVSSSMRGEKLNKTKQALKFVASQLQAKDQFGLVQFNDSVSEALPMTQMNGAGVAKATRAVDGMNASGTTNLSGGLFTGIRQVRRDTSTPKPVVFAPPTTPPAVFVGGFPASKLTVAHSYMFVNGQHHYTLTLIAGSNDISHVVVQDGGIAKTWRPGQSVSFIKNSPAQTFELSVHFSNQRPIEKRTYVCGDSTQQDFTFSAIAPTPAPMPVTTTVTLNVSHAHMFVNNQHHYTMTFVADPTIAAVTVVINTNTAKKHHHHHHHGGFSPVQTFRWTRGGPPLQFQCCSPPAQVTLQAFTTTGSHPAVGVYALGAKAGMGQIPLMFPLSHSSVFATPTVYPPQVVSTMPPQNGIPVMNSRGAADSADATRVVLLFTDGEANVGITDTAELSKQLKVMLDDNSRPDVTVFTFGFGDSHNASMLRALAEMSQGTYYHVQEAKQMPEIFADCLGGLASIVAQNIKLTIKPVAGIQILDVLTTFPRTLHDGGMTIALKDIYSEEVRDIVVKLHVNAHALPLSSAVLLAQFELVYNNLALDGAREAQKANSSTAIVETEDLMNTKNVVVDEQIQRYYASKAMEEARHAADAGNLAGAQTAIRRARCALAGAASKKSKLCVALDDDLDQLEHRARDTKAWTSEGQMFANQRYAMHMQQRSNCAGASMYSTGAKMHMQAQSQW